jgi:hypothetical protein
LGNCKGQVFYDGLVSPQFSLAVRAGSQVARHLLLFLGFQASQGKSAKKICNMRSVHSSFLYQLIRTRSHFGFIKHR